ncbi:MAG: phage holin family protein [Peptostreptococcales bacterium]
MDNHNNNEKRDTFHIGHFIIRVVVSAIILGVTAMLVPGFSISGIWTLIIAAVVLSLLDWAATKITGINATPFGRGVKGFVLASIIIYVTKFFVEGYNITVISAIIAAIIYGIIDAFLPGKRL